MAKKNPTDSIYKPSIVQPNDLGGVHSPGIDTMDEAVEVYLENVDAHILDGISERDAVVLQLATSPIQVETLSGLRIGNISSTDEADVRSLASKAGRVVKVEKGDRICVIRIVRKR